MRRVLLTEPAAEPLTLVEAKTHLVVATGADDAYISTLIAAAREYAETHCRRAIVRQQWRIYRDEFADIMDLEPWWVREVAQIQYIDPDGAEQTLSTSVYDLDIPAQVVRLAYDQSWPSIREVANAVWVDVWAGFWDTSTSPLNVTASIPEGLKAAMLLLIGDLYENRAATSEIQLYTNKAVEMLFAPYRVLR